MAGILDRLAKVEKDVAELLSLIRGDEEQQLGPMEFVPREEDDEWLIRWTSVTERGVISFYRELPSGQHDWVESPIEATSLEDRDLAQYVIETKSALADISRFLVIVPASNPFIGIDEIGQDHPPCQTKQLYVIRKKGTELYKQDGFRGKRVKWSRIDLAQTYENKAVAENTARKFKAEVVPI